MKPYILLFNDNFIRFRLHEMCDNEIEGGEGDLG